MKYNKSLIIILFSVLYFHAARGKSTVVYKTIDTLSLKMEIIYPDNLNSKEKYPAIIFFFGGGWNDGTPKQFEHQAEYFSARGLICFLVDYRVKSRQGTTPFESLKDAKSAIRYIRAQAINFHIDTAKIVASGGSAGGQLAAATALIKGFNEQSDDLSISCKPNALILFNPVIDNGPGGYGFERIGNNYKDFSPLHNITKGSPPTIIFIGTNDQFIPVETVQYYKKVMEKVGSRCDLFLYEGQPHGFFNFKKDSPSSGEYYYDTLIKADKFLVSLGFIK